MRDAEGAGSFDHDPVGSCGADDCGPEPWLTTPVDRIRLIVGIVLVAVLRAGLLAAGAATTGGCEGLGLSCG